MPSEARRFVGRRPERWWWLAVFLVLSLLLHIGIGIGSEVFNGGTKRSVQAPKSDEIEVSLGPAGNTASVTSPHLPVHPIEPHPVVASHPAVEKPQTKPKAAEARSAIKVAQPSKRESRTIGQIAAARSGDRNGAVVPVMDTKADIAEPAPPRRAISPDRKVVPPPLGLPSGVKEAQPAVVAVSKPDRVATLATRQAPKLIEAGSGHDDAPAAKEAITTTDGEKIVTPPHSEVSSGTNTKPPVAVLSNPPSAPEPRISVTRGIPFGDITGLSHGGDPNGGGGSTGTLGVSGGGATGQPFHLRLARQTSSDVGGTPEHIVYVLDVSGSMSEDGKIEKARAALHKAVGELLSDDTFTFITFSNKAAAYSDGLKPATNFYVSTMESNFDLIEPNGETNLSAAVDLALSMQGVGQIFLMSDGDPTIGITDFDELSSHIRVKNSNHIPITTFALGTGEQFEGIKFLKRIARENGGQYRYVDLSPR